MNIREQVGERWATYRSESEIQRQLPKNLWRVRLAHMLRVVAARLEHPSPPTWHDDWHMRARAQVD